MKSNITLLRLFDLPVFSSEIELASLLHVDVGRLRILANESFRFYKRYEIPKKTGGTRLITQPTREAKAIQAWILRNVLEKLQPSGAATAFRRGLGLTANATPHAANRYFLGLDLEDFFPSITSARVSGLFRSIGYSDCASEFMAKLCTVFYRLPQGAVTSPYLSNLVCLRFDRRVMGYTNRRNITYTRYADDLTFSGNDPEVLRRSAATLRGIVCSEGFRINNSKTHLSGPSGRCEVTGLVKNAANPRFGPGRKRYRLLRAEIHRFMRHGSGQRYKTEAQLLGALSFLRGIDPDACARLERYWIAFKSGDHA